MTNPPPPPRSATVDALLDGALLHFGRHGFSKTSMADIARESGLSRTALYNHFPTKAAVFSALSLRINETVLADVLAAFDAPGPWDQRLEAVIHARVGWVYDLLHNSEFGRELIDEKSRICSGAVLASNDRFEAMVASILEDAPPPRSDSTSLARVLIQSINGVLEAATTPQQARDSVSLLVSMFVRGLAA